MAYDYPIFPDEIPIVVNFLQTHSYITSFGSVNIAGDLKGYAAGQRWISVRGTGGNAENPVRVEAPRVDINVYAESIPVAKSLAKAACAAMRSMKNHVTTNAVVARVDVSTPADLTDEVNSQPRMVFDATIYLRPRKG